MSKELARVKIGENYLVIERCDNGGEFPTEIVASLETKEGGFLQDIGIIRQHYSMKNYIVNRNDNKIDVLVWGSSESEDYTNKFVVDVYNEKEEN